MAKNIFSQICETKANVCRHCFCVIIKNITIFTFQSKMATLNASDNNSNKPKIISFDPKLGILNILTFSS